MQPGWIRLKREEAHQVLDRLSGNRDAVVFSRDATEVTSRDLPFYSTHRLYRLVNYATMPTFSMLYLSNGEEFMPLNGTAIPLYAANDKAPIRLTADTVTAYLEFFFSNVQGSEGDIFLITDMDKMPFLSGMSPAQQASLRTNFQPMAVTAERTTGPFRVTATLCYGGGLMAATILVMANGRLSFENQQLLMTGIHFPYSPYSQPWLDG